MLFVWVVSFEQIYSVRDTLPDLLFVKPTGKTSVILPALCYGEIGMYWHEVFLSERAFWAGFISALKHFRAEINGQPTEGCWSHLYLDFQGCPCSRARDLSQPQLPSRAFPGAIACQGIGRSKVKHHLTHTDSLSLTIPTFSQHSWVLNASLPFSHDDSGLFFLFSGWKQGYSWRSSLYVLGDDFWFAVLPFPPQTQPGGNVTSGPFCSFSSSSILIKQDSTSID